MHVAEATVSPVSSAIIAYPEPSANCVLPQFRLICWAPTVMQIYKLTHAMQLFSPDPLLHARGMHTMLLHIAECAACLPSTFNRRGRKRRARDRCCCRYAMMDDDIDMGVENTLRMHQTSSFSCVLTVNALGLITTAQLDHKHCIPSLFLTRLTAHRLHSVLRRNTSNAASVALIFRIAGRCAAIIAATTLSTGIHVKQHAL